MVVGLSAQRNFATTDSNLPRGNLSEDLSRFPSESLHSFSFAHQSEDALHNRQSVLKRAIDFMRDRLGWGANHPGVVAAQAKVSGDSELESMMDLLVKANMLGVEEQNISRVPSLNGPLTGPAGMDEANVFDKSFESPAQVNDNLIESSHMSESPGHQDENNSLAAPFRQPEPALNSETSIPSPAEPLSSLNGSFALRPQQLKRTFTDVSLLELHNQLSEALAKPYRLVDNGQENHMLGTASTYVLGSKTPIPDLNTPSLVHGHNNRSVPAAQAVFTTEAASPWTILAANDLACLVFGVTKGEVKKLSIMEVVRQDRRAWLENKLLAQGSENTVRANKSAKTSPKASSSLSMGGGVTSQLLNKPPWRQQKAQNGDTSKQGGPYHSASKSRGVLLCGDIVPIRKRNGATGAASLWVKEKRGGLVWVVEEIAEDIVNLVLDEDANVSGVEGSAIAVWGDARNLVGRPVHDLVPGLPLIDGFAVDKTAIEKDEDAKYYAASVSQDLSVPISVSMDPATRTLRVSSFPHIAGIIVLSASDLSVISSNSVFSAALFGQTNPYGEKITHLIPQFDDILEFLTEEDKITLVDGIVVPEHRFRRARASLALRQNSADAATMFLNPSVLTARHRDGSEINIDVQMRVVRSENSRPHRSVIGEKEEVEEEINCTPDTSASSEIVYALWITYSRQLHSAILSGDSTSPVFSKSVTPHHQPSPGQVGPSSPPQEINPEDEESIGIIEPLISPRTLSQRIEEAASQPISDSPPKKLKIETHGVASPARAKDGSRKKKKISEFVILEDMGQGAYGQVKLARYGKPPGNKVVLKYVTKRRILVDTWTRDRRLGTVPLEIHVMDYLRKPELRHPNIVEMTDFFEDDINYYIEMVPHGLPGMDLFDYIEMRSTMEEAECRNIFMQVVAALHHLHTKALVVHRDIKDENIVLDGEGNVKLIDFGSAAYIKNGPFDVFVGTIGESAFLQFYPSSQNFREAQLTPQQTTRLQRSWQAHHTAAKSKTYGLLEFFFTPSYTKKTRFTTWTKFSTTIYEYPG